MPTTDAEVRAAAFLWLAEQIAIHGDVLDWGLLLRGFEVGGVRVPLLSQQGIFKPRLCALPLSIRTSAAGPYDDHFTGDALLYRYRGTDPHHFQNVWLRECQRRRVPLVYFHAVVKARYLAVWPVYVVGDEPARLLFEVQADAGALELGGAAVTGSLEGAGIAGEDARREYATRLVRQRLHQRGFRERVLDAYRNECAMCRLRHRELLDAAHIVPDTAGGRPVVPNGLALCKIHHAAFDRDVLGVDPRELRVHVRADVLREIDGPMLRHGLQDLHGQRVRVPRAAARRPDSEALAWKWARFQQAG